MSRGAENTAYVADPADKVEMCKWKNKDAPKDDDLLAAPVMVNFSRRLSRQISDFSEMKEQQQGLSAAVAVPAIWQHIGNEIRNEKVNWQSYLQSQMISQEDFNFISTYDSADARGRDQILQAQRQQCAKTFLNLLTHISKDQTIQYILLMIDDMLQEDKNRVEIFKEHSRKKKESVWTPFLNLLNRPDNLIINLTACVIAKMACWGKELMDGSDLRFYLTWLKDRLRIQGNEYIQAVARCLQLMLRVDEYRTEFVAIEGIKTLISVLSTANNFQIQYQLIFCLWVLTFNAKLAEQLNKSNAIPILADLQRDNPKEKVVRIILAVYRNLIEKPTDPMIARENSIAMVQSKVLKYLEIMEQHKYEDEDLTADIEYLTGKLRTSVQDLSSFDEYASELKSGRLEWSPVHKSAKFWQENVMRINEKNYELLKILVCLLQTSKDPLVLSVASYDIGEYVRHYPRGKRVIEQLGGKTHVMHLLANEDPNVRYEALVAVQKLMVHNWEYLGKQLEKEQSPTQPNKPGISSKA